MTDESKFRTKTRLFVEKIVLLDFGHDPIKLAQIDLFFDLNTSYTMTSLI